MSYRLNAGLKTWTARRKRLPRPPPPMRVYDACDLYVDGVRVAHGYRQVFADPWPVD